MTFDPSGIGERVYVIRINNNDPNEDPYRFYVKGFGLGEEFPDIVVNAHNTGNPIPLGDTTPSANETDFGSRDVNGGISRRYFKIENNGTTALELTGASRVEIVGQNFLDFSVNQPVFSNIAPGSSTGFSIDFNPIATGIRTATVSISNNVPDKDPYTFTIQGNGTGVDMPEITLYSETGVLIDNGYADPSIADGTDFGPQYIADDPATLIFQIWNHGGEFLNLTGSPLVELNGPQAGEFSVTAQPANTVVSPWGAFLPFEITFDPVGLGIRTAEVSIQNDDADEDPYTFLIQGIGQSRITAGEYLPFVPFGSDVSIEGDTAVVGAAREEINGMQNAGAVYALSTRPGVWAVEEKLVDNGVEADDLFGYSVAYSDGMAIIGAPGDDNHGENSGTAYIFQNSGGVWTRREKLVPDSNNSEGAGFGSGVDISGNLAIISATQSDTAGEKIYIFKKVNGAWQYAGLLQPHEAGPSIYFHSEVAIDGDTAAISGSWQETGGGAFHGAVHLFLMEGSNWRYLDTLVPEDGSPGMGFGTSLAISGDTLVIGDYGDDDFGQNSGAAYIFTREEGDWTQAAKLHPTEAAEGEMFGHSVAISGDTVVVSDVYDNQNMEVGYESIYVFTKPAQGWSDMTETTRLFPRDVIFGELTELGASLDISGDVVIASAPSENEISVFDGAVYLFKIIEE